MNHYIWTIYVHQKHWSKFIISKSVIQVQIDNTEIIISAMSANKHYSVTRNSSKIVILVVSMIH